MLFRLIPVGVFLGCSVFVSSAYAVDDNAGVVLLRTSCTESGILLNNCFTKITPLFNWIVNTRQPTQVAPLSVQIGPGTFNLYSGPVSFNDVSFIGSGRGKTTLGTLYGTSFQISGSQRLHFQNLTITGGGMTLAAVYWLGGGSSTWVNVQLDGGLYGWSETNCNLTTKATRPVHKWFSSTITSQGKVAFASQCSENWFYGSELIVTGAGDGLGIRGFTAHAANGNEATSFPEAHLYGSVIRVIPDKNTSFPEPNASGDGMGVVAIAAGQNAEVHVHNTAIDILESNISNNVAALAAINGGMIHANQSSYNLKTGPGGHIVRIVNEGGHIHAPYMWEHIPGTPLISKTGADITTITSGTSDGQPHLVIYSENCGSTGGPGWYDAVDKACLP